MEIRAAANAISYPPQASPARGGGAARQDGATPAAQGAQPTELSDKDLERIAELKARDTEVRQHEQAHLAAAGGLATSGPSYTYTRGPDGVNYAVGGEVNINTSPGGTPEETLARARQIQAAALAPAEPSSQDRAVAARARQLEQQAQVELSAQQQALQRGYGLSTSTPTIDTYA